MQLKLNIGTYCALLWSLFGEECDYYKELLKIHRIALGLLAKLK
jgi:hypothetical protein